MYLFDRSPYIYMYMFKIMKNGKVETARFRQYVKEKKFTLINCPEFGMEEELCIK